MRTRRMITTGLMVTTACFAAAALSAAPAHAQNDCSGTGTFATSL